MTDYTYSRVAALNFTTTPVTVGRSATGSVYAIGDTTFTTPLNLTTVVGGVTGTSISSDANGFFPDFTVANRTSVVFKQTGTSFTSVLTTTDPVPGAQGATGATGASGAKGDRGDLASWQATTFYPLNQVISNPVGDLVKVTTAHTSTGSYDATKFDYVVPPTLTPAALNATIDDQIEGSEYLPATFAPRSPKAPTPVIWDTDWWTDVDDAVALRLLCRAEQIGLIDIRAIIANTSFYKTPGSISAMLTYEGHGPVPIGVNAYVPATGTPSYQNGLFDLWPHHDGYATDALPSTEVYRRTLAAADDGTVDIISVGYLTALYDLIQSPADGISALTGLQLVTAKVRHLWVMGGMWPKGGENNFNRDATAKTAANYVVANWPSDITFQGFEVGASIYTGQLLVGTQLTDPLANALLDYSVAATGRQSWDPMLTWMACIGDLELAGYTAVRGTATVNSSTGDNTFTESPTGKHYYVKKAQSDVWFSRDLNARLFPNSTPLGVSTPPGVRAGTEIPLTVLHVPAAPPFVRPSRAVGITADLISGFHVDDLSSLADAAVVSHWPDRTFTASVRQNKGSSYCPTIQTVGGKRGVLFAAQKWLWSDTISLPKSLTVYAEVYWPTVPSATQTAIAGDNSLSVAVRSFHLGANSTGKVQAVAYDGVPGFADATADTVAATSWQIIVARISTTQVEAFLGAVSNGTTSITGRNDGQIGIALGSRNTDTSAEPFLGYGRQFRVYGVSHDSTQRAAVLAEMAAV